MKVKSVARQELVVGGWMQGKGKRRESIGALLLGVYERMGSCVTWAALAAAFSDSELQRLSGLLAPLAHPTSPFTSGENRHAVRASAIPSWLWRWSSRSWTGGGSLRAPGVQGPREDKRPEEVVREDMQVQAPAGNTRSRRPPPQRMLGAQTTLSARPLRPPLHRTPALHRPMHCARPTLTPRHGVKAAETTVDGRELKLSNLDKVLYPKTGFTKGDLIAYYAAIAPVLLGHLSERPLTVTSWPDGVQAKSFFQKQAPAHRPEWVRTATVASASKPIDYTLANDLPTLVWLANLAAIELHVPLARAETMERPTALVFDLDPGAPAGIVECCHVGLQLQGMFEHLGLESFAKTSGSKGLQLYVPLNSSAVSYERTKPFAKAVAETLEAAEPDLVISRMTKARRTGKVLIDWSQNDAKKTTVCVYSLRATERPTASTPVGWDEVRDPRLGRCCKPHIQGHRCSSVWPSTGIYLRPCFRWYRRCPAKEVDLACRIPEWC